MRNDELSSSNSSSSSNKTTSTISLHDRLSEPSFLRRFQQENRLIEALTTALEETYAQVNISRQRSVSWNDWKSIAWASWNNHGVVSGLVVGTFLFVGLRRNQRKFILSRQQQQNNSSKNSKNNNLNSKSTNNSNTSVDQSTTSSSATIRARNSPFTKSSTTTTTTALNIVGKNSRSNKNTNSFFSQFVQNSSRGYPSVGSWMWHVLLHAVASIGTGSILAFVVLGNPKGFMEDLGTAVPLQQGRSYLSDHYCSVVLDTLQKEVYAINNNNNDNTINNIHDEKTTAASPLSTIDVWNESQSPYLVMYRQFAVNCQRRQAMERVLQRKQQFQKNGIDGDNDNDTIEIPPPGVPGIIKGTKVNMTNLALVKEDVNGKEMIPFHDLV